MVLVARSWWAILIRGIAAILFGILALILPRLTLLVLVALFGAYALVDGIFAIAAAVRGFERRRGNSWWLLVEGIAGIIAGLVAFFWPGITALVLLYIIAGWAIVTGILEIVQAVEMRRVIRNEWLLILSGVASVIFGILLFLFPGAGALTVVWLIGIYAIVFGALLIGLSLWLRRMQRTVEAPMDGHTRAPAY
jgi:uncharacterized membrane protein HdeD (DUF308 family)